MKTQDTEGQADSADSVDRSQQVEGQTQAGLYYQATGSGDADTATRAWVETPLMAIPDNPMADSLMREMALRNAALWTYSPTLQQRLTPPAIDRLATIAVPTLVMTGALDLPDTQRVADILATEIEGARRITIPRAGHLVNMAAPGPFERELLTFLNATHP